MNRFSIDFKSIGVERFNDLQLQSLEKHQLFSNLMIVAPTGSGKSLAFLLPALLKLSKEQMFITQVLILAPTRELALQIEEVFRSLKSGEKIITLYGGHSFRIEARSLEFPSKIVIATPGRLVDHINRGTINLAEVSHLIIDEFDKLVDLGFTEQCEHIFRSLRRLSSITMTSATADCDIPSFMRFDNHHTIHIKGKKEERKLKNYAAEYTVERVDALYNLITRLDKGNVLIFCNFRESCERLSEFLWQKEVENDFYHGGMEQQDRERALIKLRNGSVNILVTTDLAARGLDIDALHYVIHFEMPQSAEAYIHRTGRVARMNKEGESYLLTKVGVSLPEFVERDINHILVDTPEGDFTPPIWETLYIGAGKKQKISKGDIVGFLVKIAKLSPDQVGVINLRDNDSYVALKEVNFNHLLQSIRGERLKKERCRFNRCR